MDFGRASFLDLGRVAQTSCLFWQWIIGNPVYPVYFGNGSSEILSILSILAMDHRKSCLSCLFWQWIIGNPVYPVYFGNGSSEILSILYILVMDPRKSCLSCLLWQWIIRNVGKTYTKELLFGGGAQSSSVELLRGVEIGRPTVHLLRGVDLSFL